MTSDDLIREWLAEMRPAQWPGFAEGCRWVKLEEEETEEWDAISMFTLK